FFPLLMALLFGGMSRTGWMIVRFPFVLLGAVTALIVAAAKGRPFSLATLDQWDEFALDRYVVRALALPVVCAFGGRWASTHKVADRLLGMAPLTTMRQIYLLWCYAFLGISVLAKGPPGVAVVGLVGVFYVLLLGRWRDLYEGKFEIKRGILLAVVI